MERGLVLLVVATMFVATVACDPGIEVTFENQTDHEIRVSVDDDPDLEPAFDTVAAGATRTMSYLSRSKDLFRVVIVGEFGDTLLDEIFNFDQLEARGMRFVVDDEGVQQNSDALPD